MFKRLSQQQLLKHKKAVNSGNLNKIRLLQSIPLMKLNDSQSVHSSIMSQSRHSSIKNIPNSSFASSQFSMRSSLIRSRSIDKKKVVFNKEETIQEVLERHYQRPFIKSMVQYLNKEWSQKQKQLLVQKKVQHFVQAVIQRSNWIKDLIDQFTEKQYANLPSEDRHIFMSLLFKQAIHSIKDLEGVIPQIIKKIPDQRLFTQQTILEELSTKILEIYDPKCLYSNVKIKERLAFYLQEYTAKKNQLKTDLCTKIIPNMKFLENVEQYLSTYQREIIKLKSQMGALQTQKNRYHQLLNRKNIFTPMNIDYDMLYEMKQKTNKDIKNDLQLNIVQYHEDKHKKSQILIATLEQQDLKLRQLNDELKEEIAHLQDQLGTFQKNVPQHRQFGIQVYLINQGKESQGSSGQGGGMMARFLDNVITPFSFNKEIAGSLINVLSIDKILFDYEAIRQRQSLRSFEEFLYQWFIIRTGCRKIAQIFVKNFLYSLKQLRSAHKRFNTFYRITGMSGFKKRNMQQDLQGIFFGTHLSWYYLIKLSLMYRRKLNQNPTGYHLFPPIQCEDIFKLPLRKIYDLVDEFFRSQEIQVPSDLSQKIDQYCINEISKFKSNDEEFQKQSLEEIHILRQINFDLLAGFVLEYVTNQKCTVLEKLLRTIDSKQKQDGCVLAYTDFEAIYRRYYRERRAKIQQIYAKLCMVNQHDMLDIQNLQPVVQIILEDQAPLRSIFQKLEPLKVLILTEKAGLSRYEKKPTNLNSYQNFRQRYYHEFYDFYSTTSFLEEVFKIVKTLVKKKLKKGPLDEQQIDKLVQARYDPPKSRAEKRKRNSQGSEQQFSSQQEEKVENTPLHTQISKKDDQDRKNVLTLKLQQWGKIMSRVPHFATRVLTIDQIVIHNMRRKEMIEATQFAWKVLRQILSILGKQ